MFKQPDVVPYDKGKYRLDEDYSFTYPIADGQITLIVRAGFIYDGASVPRWLWSLSGILPDGLIRAAALIHDQLYQWKGKVPSKNCFVLIHGRRIVTPLAYDRKACDKLFLQVMHRAGVGKTDRRRAYWAVRLFGWLAWKGKK